MIRAVGQAWLIGACGCVAAACLIGACDVEGFTPNCPGEGGDCITPAGDSAASVVTGGSPDAGSPADDAGSE
jgi:hypothetical protein